MLKRYLLSVACVLSLIACGPRMPDSNVIEGSVSYREKILLPANAIVRVQLQDVAKQDRVMSRARTNGCVDENFALQLQSHPVKNTCCRGGVDYANDEDRVVHATL